jgi:hypothetical protein
MASLRKRGTLWYYRYTDANGNKVERKGYTDKRATEQLAAAVEHQASLVAAGLVDPKESTYRAHEAKPLANHIADWCAYLLGKNNSQIHVDVAGARMINLSAISKAERLSDLTLTRFQSALSNLKDQGLALRTVHHYARLAKNLSRWAWRDGRTREDLLAHLQPPEHPESDRRRIHRPLTFQSLSGCLKPPSMVQSADG